ncbi:hypothetical protein [Octadecabacter antarcticus]|nr:hypothetical protein [Octadecabacter antarcticus]
MISNAYPDRIFGAVVILGSFIYVMAARSIAKPLFADPRGPQAFPRDILG